MACFVEDGRLVIGEAAATAASTDLWLPRPTPFVDASGQSAWLTDGGFRPGLGLSGPVGGGAVGPQG